MHKIKTILIFSLLFAYIILDFSHSQSNFTEAEEKSTKDSTEIQLTEEEEMLLIEAEAMEVPAYWMHRDDLFETFEKDSGAIVFIGNSLTQNFELAEIFKRTDLKNRGIIGDKIPGVINRIGPIIELQPSKIFIEIGINDLGNGYSEEEVLNSYEILLDTLKSTCANSKIYVQSILPTGISSNTFPTYCGEEINEIIVTVNSKLKKFSEDKEMFYIDLHSEFVKKKYLNKKYSVDGVHINGKGYLLWAEILKPFLEE